MEGLAIAIGALLRLSAIRRIWKGTDGGDAIGGHNIKHAIGGGLAISAQPLIWGSDQRCRTDWGLNVVTQSHRGFSMLHRGLPPADLPIVIGARDLSAWSQRTGTCGEVVKGKGLGLRIRSKSGFLAPFNGF